MSYSVQNIRNVCLLGHSGSGKTSLAESLLFMTGAIDRMGRVADGNTVCDYDPEEVKRQISLSTAVAPLEYKGCKINLLDTPGAFDFSGEVMEALRAADAAIIVASAKDGVSVGVEKAWKYCEERNMPRFIYISKIDEDHSDYNATFDALRERFGNKIAPVVVPTLDENKKVTGLMDILNKRAYEMQDGKRVEIELPEDKVAVINEFNDALKESVAETSEEFMDRYFEGDTFSVTEVSAALAMNVQEASIVPVCMGSPINLRGVSNLLDDICGYFPSPDKRSCNGIAQKTNEIFEANYDFTKVKSAYVWKTIADPFLGKYSLIKVCSGVIKSDDTLLNVEKGEEERLNKLYVLEGSKPIEVPELHAGDIGAIAKLNSVQTGDSLATKANPILYPKALLSTPYTCKRFKAVKKGDEDKISQALAKMMSEDKTLRVVNDSANRQSLIYGIGDQHLDIVMNKLKERYKVDVELSKPKVPFRETLRKKSDVEGKHKKQSGGHGQYGHVKMRFEPSGDLETPYVFEQVVVGGAVPKNYFPAVEKGLQECVLKGPLAAYPVVGVKATLYDGSYHPVDSSEMAFKMATILAFKKGFMEASPVLLEPIISMKVTVPDKYTGDVMGDLNKRRGRVLGMNPDHEGNTIIEADVPLLEIYGYSTVLRSMTGGSGDFSYEFARYEQAPNDIQEKEIAARASKVDSADE